MVEWVPFLLVGYWRQFADEMGDIIRAVFAENMLGRGGVFEMMCASPVPIVAWASRWAEFFLFWTGRSCP
jgi:hypothetical protein